MQSLQRFKPVKTCAVSPFVPTGVPAAKLVRNPYRLPSQGPCRTCVELLHSLCISLSSFRRLCYVMGYVRTKIRKSFYALFQNCFRTYRIRFHKMLIHKLISKKGKHKSKKFLLVFVSNRLKQYKRKNYKKVDKLKCRKIAIKTFYSPSEIF